MPWWLIALLIVWLGFPVIFAVLMLLAAMRADREEASDYDGDLAEVILFGDWNTNRQNRP